MLALEDHKKPASWRGHQAVIIGDCAQGLCPHCHTYPHAFIIVVVCAFDVVEHGALHVFLLRMLPLEHHVRSPDLQWAAQAHHAHSEEQH